MNRVEKDEAREERIYMDVVVDAYGPEERAMGWYYYLDDTLQSPFTARCTTQRPISPLRVGDEVDVLGMAPEVERIPIPSCLAPTPDDFESGTNLRNPVLSEQAAQLIEAPDNEIFISIVDLWEIAIKVSLGKLHLTKPFKQLIPEQLQKNDIASS